MKGIVLEENLIAVLRDLVDQGVLVHEDAPGHPHGVYHLTDLGKVHLERQQHAQPA
jgi:DNA-binding PadR family transcriptional regulator